MQSLRANMIQMTRVTGSGAKAHTERLLLGVYVDDLAVAFSRDGPGSLYHEFVTALQKKFEVDVCHNRGSNDTRLIQGPLG